MTQPTFRNGTAAADARIAAGHPFAAHLRRAAAVEQANPHHVWTPEDGPPPNSQAKSPT
jgi:4,5-DOPA dioxygenase extradiol